MNKISKFLFGIILLCGPVVLRANNEMIVTGTLVHIVSSFPEVNYLTTYAPSGEMVWEIPFSAQIASWDLKDNAVFVFSKTKDGSICFLTCIEASTGKILWEKNIYAPIRLSDQDGPLSNRTE